MSIETWKAEFYPVEANKVPKEQALLHSLCKWIGLRPAELARHGCTVQSAVVVDKEGNQLEVSVNTCALCTHYLMGAEEYAKAWEENGASSRCERCPLWTERGMRCDQGSHDPFDEGAGSPFASIIGGNPEPMILLIWNAMLKAGITADYNGRKP